MAHGKPPSAADPRLRVGRRTEPEIRAHIHAIWDEKWSSSATDRVINHTPMMPEVQGFLYQSFGPSFVQGYRRREGPLAPRA